MKNVRQKCIFFERFLSRKQPCLVLIIFKTIYYLDDYFPKVKLFKIKTDSLKKKKLFADSAQKSNIYFQVIKKASDFFFSG